MTHENWPKITNNMVVWVLAEGCEMRSICKPLIKEHAEMIYDWICDFSITHKLKGIKRVSFDEPVYLAELGGTETIVITLADNDDDDAIELGPDEIYELAIWLGLVQGKPKPLKQQLLEIMDNR